MAIGNNDPYTLEAVVRAGVDAGMLAMRTIHPCKVRAVNNDGTVDVDLMLHIIYVDGTDKPLPPITKVPVLYQGNDIFSISFPISIGNEGLALFAERDISLFVQNAKTGKPNTTRHHALSDGLFLPTPISLPKKVTVLPDTLLMENGSTSIAITNGKIKFTGDVEIVGDVDLSGNLETVTGEVSASGVDLSTHIHAGVESGSNSTSAPTPTP